jgi:LPXTG-motif cell wall-anchored protein
VHVEKCEFDGVPFEIAPGGQWNFIPGRAGGIGASPILPVGAQCDVRMGDDAGGVPTMTPANVEPSSVVDAATLRITINDELLNGPSIVEINIAFALAALDVTVTNEGPGAAFSNAPFEVEVTCELDSDPLHGPGGHVTLHFASDGTLLPDSQSAQLESLPVGAGCSAVETVTGGATMSGINPPATTVESDGATIAVTNVFETAPLTVTALVDGNDQGSHPDAEFVFDADCRFNGLPLPITASTPVTFSLGAGGDRELVVPVGTACTITETHDEHATAVSPTREQSATLTEAPAAMTFTNSFDVDEVTVQQAVSGDGADTYGMDVVYVPDLDCTWPSDGEQIELPNNGKVELDAAGFFTATAQVPVGATCGAQEPYGLASRLVLPAPITVALGGEFVLELDAIYDVGQLSVEKDARGNGIAGFQFGFETTCTFDTGDEVVDIPLNEFADEQYELGDGEVRLIEVLHGAHCTTSEVAAHDPLRVAVEASGFGAATFDRSAVNVILAGTDSTVLFTNFFVGSLPLTGSELSSTALWLGVGLLAGGLVLVVLRIRRKPVPRTQ